MTKGKEMILLDAVAALFSPEAAVKATVEWATVL